MGRTLKRVPLDFAWPLNKVWKGYLNPFRKLVKKCTECSGDGYSPQARRFHQEWYGHVEFDPVAYGARPLTREHPRIREIAMRNVWSAPEYYMTPEERLRERLNRQRAGIDLIELYKTKTTDELKAELDTPPVALEDLVQPGIVQIEPHREPAIQREITRLFKVCFQHHWSHHLIQADVDALVAANQLWDFTHVARTPEQQEIVRQKVAAGGNSWLPESNGYVPTAHEVNERYMTGLGGPSEWVCMKARCEREGVPVTCAKCRGDGEMWVDVDYDDLPQLTEGLLKPEQVLAIKPVGKKLQAAVVRQLYEEWREYEPPEGPGYQLWETTSEGSPMSPVFSTLEALCAHAADHCSTFGHFKASAAEWRQMLDDDFVHHQEGSMVFL